MNPTLPDPIQALEPPALPASEPPPTSWGQTLNALLKRPAPLLQAIEAGGVLTTTWRLWVLTLIGMALYGVVVGLFAGGTQLWIVPLKLSAGLLFSAAICWPSLYILICLGGGRQTPSQVFGLLGCLLALLTTLLVGFAPVAWLFTNSTGTSLAMGVLHLLLSGVCGGFALRRFDEALTILNHGRVRTLPLWCVVFVLVCLQMTTALRPILSPFTDWSAVPRKFFLQHWSEQCASFTPATRNAHGASR